MSNISRRTALATGAAAITTAAVTAPLAIKAAGVEAALATPGETIKEPLLELRQQWLDWREQCSSNNDKSDEAMAPLYARLEEIEEQIYLTPAQTPRGVAVKLELWHYYYSTFNHPWTPWWRAGDVGRMALDEKGVCMMMRDLERLAGEAWS